MTDDTSRVTVYYIDGRIETFDSLNGLEFTSDEVVEIETKKYTYFIPLFRIDKIAEEQS